jgi:taurine--2-oxoglutarate transaminase
MDGQEIKDLCKKYTMWSWSAGANVDPLPVTRAEGIYFWTADGKRFIDFNSQLMSVNIGHHHPKVAAAMKEAVDTLIFAGPSAATEPRALLGQRLAELMPGDLNTFFFTLGGAEANENAIRAARLFTGRSKILSRYRSYHGATNATMQLTGDPRRLPNEPGMPGVVRVMDPRPYKYSFGDSPAEVVEENLKYLEEVIMYEGPHTIAAMIIETVTGTNGILPPPEGYLQGLKALLDRHGILLICDEVMCGWGRTGKLFGFEHGGIQPDIVTMAKGLTSSYFPLGCMAVSDRIAEHFRKNVFWGGLTYNAHPLGLATALACVNVLLEEGMVENAAKMEGVMRGHMEGLKARHPSVKEHRCIGLFGIVELQRDAKRTPVAPYGGTDPVMGRLNKRFQEEGLYTIMNQGNFMCNPPLCITEAQLADAFGMIDRSLSVVDEAFFG